MCQLTFNGERFAFPSDIRRRKFYKPTVFRNNGIKSAEFYASLSVYEAVFVVVVSYRLGTSCFNHIREGSWIIHMRPSARHGSIDRYFIDVLTASANI